jgi:hypothetical protein
VALAACGSRPQAVYPTARRCSRYRQSRSCGSVRPFCRFLAPSREQMQLLMSSSSYGTKASIDDLPQEVLERIHASVQYLRHALDQGHSVYGMPRIVCIISALAHPSQELPPALGAALTRTPRIQTPFKLPFFKCSSVPCFLPPPRRHSLVVRLVPMEFTQMASHMPFSPCLNLGSGVPCSFAAIRYSVATLRYA